MSMTLNQLLPELKLQSSNANIEVFGVTDDSRKLQAGFLYLAVDGDRFKAAQFLPEAIEKGACAVLSDENAKISAANMPSFTIPKLGLLRGVIASRFLGFPSTKMKVVAVTGTNGKTSCSQYVAQALRGVGVSCGVVGTTGFGFPGELHAAGLTTPDAITLQENLKALLDAGASVVSIEASSHGLAQGRLNGVSVDIAIFTNLSRDHLDYHGTIENYAAAKTTLFTQPDLQSAIVNLDDDLCADILQAVERTNANRGKDVEQLTYSVANQSASVYCESVEYTPTGFQADVHTPFGNTKINCSLLGEFNVSNVLAVIAVLGTQGFSIAEIGNAVSNLKNVLGRMDMLLLPNGATVVIDYAHTPDALEKALLALKQHSAGRVICVMGCGGDRDKGKRPEMGNIAHQLADKLIVTSDNPRTEDPTAIIEDILQGVAEANQVLIMPERSEAVAQALLDAVNGDLILIAGKGHEPYQDIGGVKIAYSDYEEVQKFVSSHSDSEET